MMYVELKEVDTIRCIFNEDEKCEEIIRILLNHKRMSTTSFQQFKLTRNLKSTISVEEYIHQLLPFRYQPTETKTLFDGMVDYGIWDRDSYLQYGIKKNKTFLKIVHPS